MEKSIGIVYICSMEKEFIPYEQALELKELDMKLYTEKQMRNLYEGLLQNVGTSIKQSDLPKVDEYINSLKPIELPSDEEIGLKALDVKSNVNKLLFHDVSFQFGAKWVIEHIEKQK